MPRELKKEMIERDEAWLLSGEVAVPLEITVRESTATVEYYPSAKAIVDEFLRLYGADYAMLFSREAILWATERLGAFLLEYGFELSPDSYDYYINYVLTALRTQPHTAVKKLMGGEDFDDLTDTDIDGLISRGYIVYAAVVDNKIVAVANTGEAITDDTARSVEIGVDTAEKYRRRGYGKACVGALIAELEQLGHTAIYECASGNTASIRLAESFGGEIVYRKYYVVGFGG